jgi:hypothetical protein
MLAQAGAIPSSMPLMRSLGLFRLQTFIRNLSILVKSFVYGHFHLFSALIFVTVFHVPFSDRAIYVLSSYPHCTNTCPQLHFRSLSLSLSHFVIPSSFHFLFRLEPTFCSKISRPSFRFYFKLFSSCHIVPAIIVRNSIGPRNLTFLENVVSYQCFLCLLLNKVFTFVQPGSERITGSCVNMCSKES